MQNINNNNKYDDGRRRNRKLELSLDIAAAVILIVVIVAATSVVPLVSQQQSAIAQTTTASNNITTNQTTSLTTVPTLSKTPGSALKLSRASTPVDIPLRKGYENGNDVFFITTDASDQKIAAQVTNATGFKVNFAPLLARAPDEAVAQFYVFKNGVKGDGILGFQPNVANAQPGDMGYSPVWKVNLVEWNSAISSPQQELKSEKQIMDAKAKGDLTVTPTEMYVNCPFVKWNGGSMKIRVVKTITDDSPYVGGQVLKIDTNNKVVTMVAHRGFGPDGKTIYYIVADATPQMPAAMMGVTLAPTDEKLVSSPVAVDLLQFMNGIKGSGPMGFQAGIGAANPGDSNYSPLWRISFMEWKDPFQARILQTLSDITAMQQAGMLTVTPAFGGKHVVNCPFFDPSTVFEHQSKA